MKNLLTIFFLCLSICAITLEAQTTQWQHLSGSHRVNSIAHDGNIIWFGTDEYGVGKYDRSRNYTTYFNTENSPITANKIHQVYLTPKGDLWAQAHGVNEWFVYDGQKWIVFDENNSLLQSSAMEYDIAATSDGTVWLGHSNGLLQFDGTNWKNIEIPANTFNSFSVQIAVDQDDNLWVSGSTHLLQYGGNTWSYFD